MRWVLLVLSLSQFAIAGNAAGAERPLREVTIADPFIELHTGPGSGYPDLLRCRARRADRAGQAAHGVVQGSRRARPGRLGPLRAAHDDAESRRPTVRSAGARLQRLRGAALGGRGAVRRLRRREHHRRLRLAQLHAEPVGRALGLASARPLLRQHDGDGRHRPSHVSGLARVAVFHARRRRHQDRAEGDARRDDRSNRFGRARRRRRSHVSDSQIRIPRASTRPTSCSRAATTTRKYRNGKQGSRSFSNPDARRRESHRLRPRSTRASRRHGSRPSSSRTSNGARSSRRSIDTEDFEVGIFARPDQRRGLRCQHRLWRAVCLSRDGRVLRGARGRPGRYGAHELRAIERRCAVAHRRRPRVFLL